jgi:uncharacterized protein (TIGR04255 family)
MVADRFPSQDEEYVYSGQMYVEEAGEPLQTEATNQLNGFRFTSHNKRQVFYARLDGFALSVGAPYDRWETFRNEARHLWDLYRSVANPEGISRAAMRYVNQFDITEYVPDRSNVELGDYLNVYPETPRDWTFNNFFLQLQLWQEDLNSWLIVNEASVRAPDQETAMLQLDFDFFREQSEDPWQAGDDTDVWNFLELLHTRKNEVFEASITEKIRRFIK